MNRNPIKMNESPVEIKMNLFKITKNPNVFVLIGFCFQYVEAY